MRATVTDDVVNGTYPLAIDDCDLYPIAKPEFDETDLVEAGKPYTFSFTVTVKPEIEISSYEPVEIELPAEGTTDARSTSRSTPCASTTTRSRTLPPPRR